MKPFVERVQIWTPEPETAKEHVYLQLTRSGAIIALGTALPRARLPGGADHGFPWLHYRFRSVDGGQTWQLHERNWWEPEKRGRLASVVDQETGEIFVFTQGTWPLQDDRGRPMSESWMITNYRQGRQMGARLTMESSQDDGQTWISTDITDQFYTYPNAGLAWFIGGGIQLVRGPSKGRLLIPARYFTGDWQEVDPAKHNILYHHPALGAVYDDGIGQVAQVLDEQAHNAVIYSDDHGKIWQWGGSSQGFVGEACIVELADGSVYMNNRNHDPRSLGYRSWCVSRDGGETFSEFGVHEELVEGRCHAAVTRYVDPATDKVGCLLFSNPASFEGVNQLHTREIGSASRRNMTVRASYDEGKTWPVSRLLSREAGYSSLVVLGDGTILCGFGHWVYRFNLAWLEAGG